MPEVLETPGRTLNNRLFSYKTKQVNDREMNDKPQNTFQNYLIIFFPLNFSFILEHIFSVAKISEN